MMPAGTNCNPKGILHTLTPVGTWTPIASDYGVRLLHTTYNRCFLTVHEVGDHHTDGDLMVEMSQAT
jgi:hypothetical protein